MTENREVTVEEKEAIKPILNKLGIADNANIVRFIDTRFDKIYNTYLINDKGRLTFMKKSDERLRDKRVYDKYFAGKDFSVPKVYDCVRHDKDVYILMEFVEGVDARDCDVETAKQVGADLAGIQSFYLTEGSPTEAAENYFNKYIERYYNSLEAYFSDLDIIWEPVKKRFFEVPHTLVHDDLLPINVIVGGDKTYFIDWEIAAIYPYFIDISRFALVTNEKQEFNICEEAQKGFFNSYYEEMVKNPLFKVSREQYRMDIVISAFFQYMSFLDYEKGDEAVKNSGEYKVLKEIVDFLIEMFTK